MYVYEADMWCNACGEALREVLKTEGVAVPEDPSDLTSYDSDDYPAGPYPDDEECDTPGHCAFEEDCPNCIELEDGSTVGALVSGLTKEGIDYVKSVDDSPLKHFWLQHFHIEE